MYYASSKKYVIIGIKDMQHQNQNNNTSSQPVIYDTVIIDMALHVNHNHWVGFVVILVRHKKLQKIKRQKDKATKRQKDKSVLPTIPYKPRDGATAAFLTKVRNASVKSLLEAQQGIELLPNYYLQEKPILDPLRLLHKHHQQPRI